MKLVKKIFDTEIVEVRRDKFGGHVWADVDVLNCQIS
jgi:hypothetical protein